MRDEAAGAGVERGGLKRLRVVGREWTTSEWTPTGEQRPGSTGRQEKETGQEKRPWFGKCARRASKHFRTSDELSWRRGSRLILRWRKRQDAPCQYCNASFRCWRMLPRAPVITSSGAEIRHHKVTRVSSLADSRSPINYACAVAYRGPLSRSRDQTSQIRDIGWPLPAAIHHSVLS